MKKLTVMVDLNEEELRTYLLDSLNLLGIDYSFINFEDLEESNCFDYMVINNSLKHKLTDINSTYCFINMDNNFNENMNIYGNLITYGIGRKNTVTISSFQENNLGFVYCLQRYLDLGCKGILEPQEVPLHVEFLSITHLYALMLAVTIGLIEGLKIEEIEKKLANKVLYLS